MEFILFLSAHQLSPHIGSLTILLSYPRYCAFRKYPAVFSKHFWQARIYTWKVFVFDASKGGAIIYFTSHCYLNKQGKQDGR